ncbi:hypothetical protein [Chryseobacterium sp.]|uniref:hypothetical protein n=1 Tax=Chryseobacterium sp. TaxID=1871047 RepID=UPI0011CB4DCD|nr:hypothetical protein [Chryseobacterium sp.]TXF77732.1 hypothetical protein FUA25_07355 [Chryseobacterium sp.]
MKKYILIFSATALLVSCTKVEEKINEVVTKTTETAKQKAQETVNETISNSINSITKTENAEFSAVFPGADAVKIEEFSGKKLQFPNGSPAYFFKYKADPAVLISFLEKQTTTNEGKSDQNAQKISGENIIEKISFVEKFLPESVVSSGFLQDLKNDKTMEYYQLRRFPNKSTIIVSPKNGMVYQFVEIQK